MTRRSYLIALVALVVVERDAAASVVRCWGGMREPSCQPTDAVWSPTSRPTFGAGCEACWTTPDGGACGPLDVETRGFQVKVGGRSFGTEHFEVVGTSCGNERLMRYKGPLFPGETHELIYPGNVNYSQPLAYRVTFQVDTAVLDGGVGAAPSAGDASSTTVLDGGVGAAPSAGDASATPERGEAGPPGRGAAAASGCRYGGATSNAPVALIVLAFALRWRARRRA